MCKPVRMFRSKGGSQLKTYGMQRLKSCAIKNHKQRGVAGGDGSQSGVTLFDTALAGRGRMGQPSRTKCG